MKNNPICYGTGFIALDILIKGEDRNITHYVGGSCGNVMMILSHLGLSTYPIARLGIDKYSQRIIQELSKHNVNTNYISQSETGSTPIIIQRNIIDKNGVPKHKFELINPITGKYFPRFKSITIKIADSIISNTEINPNIFYFDRISPGILRLVKHYKSNGTLVIFEPSKMNNKEFGEVLKYVDILKYSDQRLREYKEIYASSSIPLEIETKGEKGLIYRINNISNEWHEMLPFKIDNIIDSSGAGDWTTCGIIYYLAKFSKYSITKLSQLEIADILFYSQKLGALNCLFEGSRGLMRFTQGEIMRMAEEL